MEKDARERGLCLSNRTGPVFGHLPGQGQSNAPADETTPENPGIRDSDGGSLALPKDHRTQVENTTLLNPSGIERGGPPNRGGAPFLLEESDCLPRHRNISRSAEISPGYTLYSPETAGTVSVVSRWEGRRVAVNSLPYPAS